MAAIDDAITAIAAKVRELRPNDRVLDRFAADVGGDRQDSVAIYVMQIQRNLLARQYTVMVDFTVARQRSRGVDAAASAMFDAGTELIDWLVDEPLPLDVNWELSPSVSREEGGATVEFTLMDGNYLE